MPGSKSRALVQSAMKLLHTLDRAERATYSGAGRAILVIAMGVLLVAANWTDLATVMALRLHGVTQEATVTYKEYEGYAIRQLMHQAALDSEVDPDRVSFVRSLRVVRRQVMQQAGFSPSAAGPGHHGHDR